MFESKIWKIIIAVGGLIFGLAEVYDSGVELVAAIKEPEKTEEETPEQNGESK